MSGQMYWEIQKIKTFFTTGMQLLAAFCLAFSWVTLLPSSVFAADEDVVINELMPDPVSITDANGEWIELYNAGEEDVDLTDWKLDGDTLSGTIPAKGFFVICIEDDTTLNGDVDCDIELSISLSNTGDTVTLLNDSDEPIDSVTYESEDVNPSGDSDKGESIIVEKDGGNKKLSNDSSNVYNTDSDEVDYGTPGSAAPSIPELLSPADMSFLNTTTVNFDWEDSTDQDTEESDVINYRFELSISMGTDSDGAFNFTEATADALTESMHSESSLSEGTYYWHVKSVDADEKESNWSEIWKFTIDTTAPSTFEDLLSPLDGSIWTTPICIAGFTTDNYALDHINIYAKDAKATTYSFVKEAAVNSEEIPEECEYLLDELESYLEPIFTTVNDEQERLVEFGDISFWFAAWNPLTEAPFFEGENVYDFKVSGVDKAGNKEASAFANNVVWDVQAPSVNAGPDIEECVPFVRIGQASDDGSGLKSVRWSVVSGPGNVQFSSPNNLKTTIEADAFGEYTIRLTATDNVGNVNFDDFTLDWVPVPSGQSNQGSTGHFVGSSVATGSSGQVTVDTDSDGDGFSDAEEVEAGTNPNDPNSFPGSDEETDNADGEEDVLADSDDDFNILWLLALAGVIGLLYFLLSRREEESEA